jgi:hypothetical protein
MISQPELFFLQKVCEFVRSDVLRAVKTLTVVKCVVTPVVWLPTLRRNVLPLPPAGLDLQGGDGGRSSKMVITSYKTTFVTIYMTTVDICELSLCPNQDKCYFDGDILEGYAIKVQDF